MTTSGGSNRLYKVQSILACFPDKPYAKKTQFLVKWKNFPEEDAELLSLDELITCPKLILDFENKRRQALVDSHPGPAHSAPCIPVLPETWLLLIPKDESEFVPSAQHRVRKIRHQTERAGVKYLFVHFHNSTELFMVRRCVMDFLYPTSVVLFLLKVERRRLSLECD